MRDAIAYLNDPLPGNRFPLDFVSNLARKCHDDETRLSLLQLAIRAWRNPVPDSPSPRERHAGSAFTGLFSRFWNLLPHDVAAPVLRELFQQALKATSAGQRFPLTGEPGGLELASEEKYRLRADASVTVPRSGSGALRDGESSVGGACGQTVSFGHGIGLRRPT